MRAGAHAGLCSAALLCTLTTMDPAAAQDALPQGAGEAHARWSVAMQLQQRPGFEGYKAQPGKPWHVHDALVQQREQLDDARLTIEFRPRSASADLRDWGALRMQFSSHNTLSLRPRRGGMHLAWRATF